jgi:predicted RNA-binding protein associated with RNAse of E/G family
MHAPKRETFLVDERINIDPKGFRRPVDEYRLTGWGLYMARPADHPRFHYLESWLIPSLGLRVSVFHFRPGCEIADQDHYVDIGKFWFEAGSGAPVWHSRDYYLDLVVKTGVRTEVLDIDELLAAAGDDVISPADANLAVAGAFSAVDAIAAHGHSVDAWLASEGMPLTWLDPAPQPPA